MKCNNCDSLDTKEYIFDVMIGDAPISSDEFKIILCKSHHKNFITNLKTIGAFNYSVETMTRE